MLRCTPEWDTVWCARSVSNISPICRSPGLHSPVCPSQKIASVENHKLVIINEYKVVLHNKMHKIALRYELLLHITQSHGMVWAWYGIWPNVSTVHRSRPCPYTHTPYYINGHHIEGKTAENYV